MSVTSVGLLGVFCYVSACVSVLSFVCWSLLVCACCLLGGFSVLRVYKFGYYVFFSVRASESVPSIVCCAVLVIACCLLMVLCGFGAFRM